MVFARQYQYSTIVRSDQSLEVIKSITLNAFLNVSGEAFNDSRITHNSEDSFGVVIPGFIAGYHTNVRIKPTGEEFEIVADVTKTPSVWFWLAGLYLALPTFGLSLIINFVYFISHRRKQYEEALTNAALRSNEPEHQKDKEISKKKFVERVA